MRILATLSYVACCLTLDMSLAKQVSLGKCVQTNMYTTLTKRPHTDALKHDYKLIMVRLK